MCSLLWTPYQQLCRGCPQIMSNQISCEVKSRMCRGFKNTSMHDIIVSITLQFKSACQQKRNPRAVSWLWVLATALIISCVIRLIEQTGGHSTTRGHTEVSRRNEEENMAVRVNQQKYRQCRQVNDSVEINVTIHSIPVHKFVS